MTHNHNENEVIFHENHQKSLNFAYKTQRFQSAIFTFRTVEFSSGNTKESESQNDVVKTLWFTVEWI